MTDKYFAAAAEGSVGVHARDPLGNPIFVGTYPTVEQALAAAAGLTYVEITVNDPATPGGLITLPVIEPLVFSAPEGWMARLDMSEGLNYLSLGGDADFYVIGNSGDNNIFGSVGDDVIVGQGGNDFLEGFTGDDMIQGGAGNDTVLGMEGDDNLFGDDGDDEVLGDDGSDRLDGGNGKDTLNGGDGRDVLRGGKGADSLDGGDRNDKLLGGAGADQMVGGAGSDTLTGGTGRDILTGDGGGPGAGADVFVFNPGDSVAAARRDVITDFETGIDKIDLGAFGVALDFIGSTRFQGNAGEVRYANGILSLDADGDRAADLQVQLGGLPFDGGDLI